MSRFLMGLLSTTAAQVVGVLAREEAKSTEQVPWDEVKEFLADRNTYCEHMTESHMLCMDYHPDSYGTIAVATLETLSLPYEYHGHTLWSLIAIFEAGIQLQNRHQKLIRNGFHDRFVHFVFGILGAHLNGVSFNPDDIARLDLAIKSYFRSFRGISTEGMDVKETMPAVTASLRDGLVKASDFVARRVRHCWDDKTSSHLGIVLLKAVLHGIKDDPKSSALIAAKMCAAAYE